MAGAWSVLRLFGARSEHKRLSNVAYQRQLLSGVTAGHVPDLGHRPRSAPPRIALVMRRSRVRISKAAQFVSGERLLHAE